MKIIVGTPVYIKNDLHLEFTQQTLESISSCHEIEKIVAVNYCEPSLNSALDEIIMQNLAQRVDTWKNAVSIGWNAIIKDALRTTAVDYILVINNDIILHPKAIDNLVQFAEEHKEFIMWTGNEYPSMRTLKNAEIGVGFDDHPHFSCFMIKPEFVALLGEKEKDTGEPYPGLFDENIEPAYYEDGDMHNRILRAGFKAGKTASALFYHFGSRTIKSDEEMDRMNVRTYEKNREYFHNKFGFDTHGKAVENDDPIRFAYQQPFNK